MGSAPSSLSEQEEESGEERESLLLQDAKNIIRQANAAMRAVNLLHDTELFLLFLCGS